MRPSGNIFAAIDADGAIRFIDDVVSGMACGCFCPACGSPLVAKKGAVKVHHFAHEASQERPECFAGALNLLRRIAVQFLREHGKPLLPPYCVDVTRRLLSGTAREAVSWDAQPSTVEWFDEGNYDAPIGRMVLDNSVEVDVTLVIADDPPRPSSMQSSRGQVCFYTYLPEYATLCSQEGVVAHLRATGRFEWIYQPDAYGLIDDAVKRLRARFDAQEAEATARAARDKVAFESFLRQRAASQPATPAPVLQCEPEEPGWAKHKKRNVPYFGYRFADGSVWVYFELERAGYGVRCLSDLPGWPQMLPANWGAYDAELGLAVRDSAPAFIGAVATRISSNLLDVLQLVDGRWNGSSIFQRL